MTIAEIVSALKQKFGDAVLSTVEAHGEHTLCVTLAQVKNLLRYCRDEMAFDYLVDISSLDHMGEEPRFEMVYELYGYSHGKHLRIKSRVSEDAATNDRPSGNSSTNVEPGGTAPKIGVTSRSVRSSASIASDTRIASVPGW